VLVGTKHLFKNISLHSSLVKVPVLSWLTFKIRIRYAYFDNTVINTRIKLTYKIYVDLVASLIVNIKKILTNYYFQ
jgi:hypothetical protein